MEEYRWMLYMYMYSDEGIERIFEKEDEYYAKLTEDLTAKERTISAEDLKREKEIAAAGLIGIGSSKEGLRNLRCELIDLSM